MVDWTNVTEEELVVVKSHPKLSCCHGVVLAKGIEPFVVFLRPRTLKFEAERKDIRIDFDLKELQTSDILFVAKRCVMKKLIESRNGRDKISRSSLVYPVMKKADDRPQHYINPIDGEIEVSLSQTPTFLLRRDLLGISEDNLWYLHAPKKPEWIMFKSEN